MKFGIDRYVGNWKNQEGYRLQIRKKDETNAWVALFSPFGPPISRPYWGGKKTVDMLATYNDYIGDFDVQLWGPGSGFCLNLNHTYSTRIDDYGKEILAQGLSRYQKDDHLDAFYALFGELNSYKREKVELCGEGYNWPIEK